MGKRDRREIQVESTIRLEPEAGENFIKILAKLLLQNAKKEVN